MMTSCPLTSAAPRIHKVILGLYSLSGKTSYRKISWSLEAARFGFKLIQSLWNLAGTSAALLPRCLSNFRAIRPFQHPISRLRDFTRFGGKTSYRLVNRVPGYLPVCVNDILQYEDTQWWCTLTGDIQFNGLARFLTWDLNGDTLAYLTGTCKIVLPHSRAGNDQGSGLPMQCHVNLLVPRQNGRHFADDISKCIFVN